MQNIMNFFYIGHAIAEYSYLTSSCWILSATLIILYYFVTYRQVKNSLTATVMTLAICHT